MKYTILDKKTNKILRTLECLDIDIQVSEDEYYVDGHYQDDKYYYDGGKFIEIPNKPSQHHQFDFNLKQWVEIPGSKAIGIRNVRDKLLKDSDWTQLEDNQLTLKERESWKMYRQQLRDITKQPGFPDNVLFPKISEV